MRGHGVLGKNINRYNCSRRNENPEKGASETLAAG
jgi:hypothetical protein